MAHRRTWFGTLPRDYVALLKGERKPLTVEHSGFVSHRSPSESK